MLCGNTLHRLIMLATHVFGVACAGTTLNLGGTESGLSFSYHGNPSPSGDGFQFPSCGGVLRHRRAVTGRVVFTSPFPGPGKK